MLLLSASRWLASVMTMRPMDSSPSRSGTSGRMTRSRKVADMTGVMECGKATPSSCSRSPWFSLSRIRPVSSALIAPLSSRAASPRESSVR